MKKIFGIIFLNLLIFNSGLNAQVCSGVSAEVIAPSQQGGSYNYFGVRVALDHTYGQDVTVTGYIFPDGSFNQNNPFTLVITSGNLTAETDVYFFQTSPADGAGVEISTVTPCPTDPIIVLNNAGQIHNEYQEYLLDYIVSLNMNLTDTSTLKQIIQSKTEDFFQDKGINVNNPIQIQFANGSNSYQFSTSGYSTEGTAILEDLKTLIINYDPENDESFFSSLNNLQQLSLDLTDPMEIYMIGIPVSITIYSFTYWKNNADRWADTFYEQDSLRNLLPDPIAFIEKSVIPDNTNSLIEGGGPNMSNYYYSDNKLSKETFFKKCNINLWKLGGADVSGAVSGAWGGGILGPGGAFAGAVLVSATTSLGNLTNQVISCYVSWWPF